MTVKNSILPRNRLFALWRSDEKGKRVYILKPAVVVGRGVFGYARRSTDVSWRKANQLRLMAVGEGGASRGFQRHDVTACFKSLMPVGDLKMFVIN